ncbi:hypothetical protein OPT61_g2470 [Boeremia exigua]|uniref:Uncharacterized protein n=1 Tax=Boeremia exigua TaxID=749465 RepID=A0ACC2ILM8_9PLEO|nr:hypothetical protein OPT61_g2470 [Boeremia exigua]
MTYPTRTKICNDADGCNLNQDGAGACGSEWLQRIGEGNLESSARHVVSRAQAETRGSVWLVPSSTERERRTGLLITALLRSAQYCQHASVNSVPLDSPCVEPRYDTQEQTTGSSTFTCSAPRSEWRVTLYPNRVDARDQRATIDLAGFRTTCIAQRSFVLQAGSKSYSQRDQTTSWHLDAAGAVPASNGASKKKLGVCPALTEACALFLSLTCKDISVSNCTP